MKKRYFPNLRLASILNDSNDVIMQHTKIQKNKNES